MPTTITGKASDVSNALTRTITDATNATPIVITTSANHLFATDDTVYIANVGGNTAANGTWTITKISATTFSLNTSVGSGAYTAGGTAIDIALTPQFQAPSDGDVLDAASVNAALDALADRTQFLALLMGTLRKKVFTASGTFTAPANCGPFGIVVGWGAGGGGGGGTTADTTANNYYYGGGAGGGAKRYVRLVALTRSANHTVTIGAAGTGGAAGAEGIDGGASAFGSESFPGGAGGKGGGSPNVADHRVVLGGGSLGIDPSNVSGYSSFVNTDEFLDFDAVTFFRRLAGEGGVGAANVTYANALLEGAQLGMPSDEGFDGGTFGAGGTDAATRRGGGGGGGGGAGPGAQGGDGGAGGNANGAGAGANGSVGTAGAANSGAGGGGGGAGGCGSASGGTGAAGGAGGSGSITVYYFGDQV